MAVKQNPIDRFLSWVSPAAALRRARARHALRAYEGASKGRRTEHWRAPGSSANKETENAGGILRNRARDLVRNNPFAARALQVFVSNVVGYGIRTQIKNASGQKIGALQKAWEEWADTTAIDYLGRHDFVGLQAQVMRMIPEAGEALIIRKRVPAENGQIPLKIMVLEPDYIDTMKVDSSTVQGIKLDAQGRIQGYWIFPEHPGDQGLSGVKGARAPQSILIPAEDIRHVFRADRAGQLRGISWFAPVMIILKDLDEFMDATLIKQKVAAAFAAFVHDIEAPVDIEQSPPLGEKMEPGIIEVLPPGKDVKFSNPPSVAEFDPYTRTLLRSIAAGLGVTYEALTSDYSNVNFSSGRMGWLEFQRNIEAWRWQMLIPQFCAPVTEWFFAAAELRGLRRNGAVAKFTAPSREMIDPNSEMAAMVTAIRSGLKSWSQAVQELGDDPEERLNEIEEINKQFDAKGLILDIDPRRIMKASGSLQPEQGTEADSAGGFRAQGGKP